MVKPLRASLYASAASSSRNCPTCFLVSPVFSDNRFRVSDFEIPATYSSSSAALGLIGSRRILHERTRAHDATVPLRVFDDRPDRPEWLRETIRLLTGGTAAERERLLARVAQASDADLAKGSDDDWGLGQVATHLLIVERGVALIGLRLATGSEPGPTGQPRPAASAVTRAGIESLAGKAVATAARLGTEVPAEPHARATARHPYYRDLNCFGWLLMLPEHYRAHLEALDRDRPSALYGGRPWPRKPNLRPRSRLSPARTGRSRRRRSSQRRRTPGTRASMSGP